MYSLFTSRPSNFPSQTYIYELDRIRLDSHDSIPLLLDNLIQSVTDFVQTNTSNTDRIGMGNTQKYMNMINSFSKRNTSFTNSFLPNILTGDEKKKAFISNFIKNEIIKFYKSLSELKEREEVVSAFEKFLGFKENIAGLYDKIKIESKEYNARQDARQALLNEIREYKPSIGGKRRTTKRKQSKKKRKTRGKKRQ